MLDREELFRLLINGASGMYLHEAAVVLLDKHGYWLGREDFLTYVDVDRSNDWAAIDYRRLMPALDGGNLPAGEEEAKILRIAASLSGIYPVLLREVVEGIDLANIKLVAEAIMYADGFLSSTAQPAP